MEFPDDLKYTKEHEWVKVEGDTATVGITDYAQDALGDVVFVELPKTGDSVEKSKGAGVVESVKSVSDIYAPASGEVAEVNGSLEDSPELVNKSPYGEGWMFKLRLKDAGELDGLMDAGEYSEFVGEQGK
ncbi:MAG: glycine cleavage system protein GcvH [Candidatus Altiarchaeales archaeon]|nr:glycine cleavage system protein GcvH [Candidatus Altiarchaeales archaeon]MBD3416014.1 glycine cleavage system protein GcvH [Candidatus Altiarchaeales archaeon]